MVTSSRKRDPAATRRRIEDAALALIAEGGFAALGVNALAAQADIDKVLVYRYFGGLDGVIDALAARVDLWAGSDTMADVPEGDYGTVMAAFLARYVAVLRGNPALRRVLAWELVDDSPAVRRLAAARSRAVSAWFASARRKAGPPAEGVDAPAVNAILIAAAHHLVLAAAASGSFAGADLTDDANWRRLDAAFSRILAAVHEKPDRPAD